MSTHFHVTSVFKVLISRHVLQGVEIVLKAAENVAKESIPLLQQRFKPKMVSFQGQDEGGERGTAV